MWRLTDDQRELREQIRAVVRERIQPRVREIDEGCEYPRDLYGVMAEHNLLGLSRAQEASAGAARATCRGAPTSRSWRRSRAPSR